MTEPVPYNPHESHDVVDVSDVTLKHDLLCRNCDLKDEMLNGTQCTGEQYKESTFTEYVIQHNHFEHGWCVYRSRDVTEESARKFMKDKDPNKYRVKKVTITTQILKI